MNPNLLCNETKLEKWFPFCRQFIFVVGNLVLQNIIIMGLQHLYTRISHHLLDDMQVGISVNSFNNPIFAWSVVCYNELKLPVLADVIVHRLLAASLSISKLPSIFQDRVQLTSISDSMASLPFKTLS